MLPLLHLASSGGLDDLKAASLTPKVIVRQGYADNTTAVVRGDTEPGANIFVRSPAMAVLPRLSTG